MDTVYVECKHYRLFLRSERTGDWLLNLHTSYRMLTYILASGHTLYQPQLLFERLMIEGTNAKKLPDGMGYELYAYTPALFESRHALLETKGLF